MNDEINLIIRAKQGDLQAFEELILLYEKLIYSIAYRYFPNAEDAADMAQEAFLKAYRGIGRFTGSGFKSWLCTIITNTCVDELRRRKNKTTVSIDRIDENDGTVSNITLKSKEPGPEEYVTSRETYQELIAAINKLSINYRNLIILRDMEGLGYEELSVVTGVGMGTVKSRLSRARKRLRELLFEWEQK